VHGLYRALIGRLNIRATTVAENLTVSLFARNVIFMTHGFTSMD
jgi:hypothetical protein